MRRVCGGARARADAPLTAARRTPQVLPALSDEAARAALPKGFQTQAVPSGRRYIRVTPDPAL